MLLTNVCPIVLKERYFNSFLIFFLKQIFVVKACLPFLCKSAYEIGNFFVYHIQLFLNGFMLLKIVSST